MQSIDICLCFYIVYYLMNFFSYLSSAVFILHSYDGKEPFHNFIKKLFAAEKKYGSRDRKQIASLCYNYFRLGHSNNTVSIEDRILLGTFLCETKRSDLLESLKPGWNDMAERALTEKLSFITADLSIYNIFPFKSELSEGIDAEKFNVSFLIQPDLFLRIRPGHNKRVTGKLSGAGISYKLISENCIALPNASKVDTVIELDKEAVVQDRNSQRVGDFLTVRRGPSDRVWDCCAASGGKSIMVYDINRNIDLTVSDKRGTILENLHRRFAKAGIKKYHSFIADLENSKFIPDHSGQNSKFDLIICDAPCTGSGTWARTPEQLFYCKKGMIEKYAALQKSILQNVIPLLKPGGMLLYVTCSVFKQENEAIVKFVEEKFNLTLNKMEVLKGYEMKADTMFAALLTAPVS